MPEPFDGMMAIWIVLKLLSYIASAALVAAGAGRLFGII
jgi:hypothetical protein